MLEHGYEISFFFHFYHGPIKNVFVMQQRENISSTLKAPHPKNPKYFFSYLQRYLAI